MSDAPVTKIMDRLQDFADQIASAVHGELLGPWASPENLIGVKITVSVPHPNGHRETIEWTRKL